MQRRILFVLVLAGILGALYASGFFGLVHEPQRVRDMLETLGVWAPILYVVVFAALEPFFVPAIAFIIPGALFFSFAELFWLSWLGAVGAGVVGFSFARYLGRDYAETHMPKRFRAYDEQLARHALRTVILIRMTLFLAPPAHWFLGLSQIRFAPFLLGTALGFLPGIALVTYLTVTVGESIEGWLAQHMGWVLVTSVVLAVAVVWIRRLRARREPRGESPSA